MTKAELLGVMRKWGACDDATRYVSEHASDDAAAIIDECDRLDWLIWLLGRERRLDRFVRVCANRAKTSAVVTSYSYYASALGGAEQLFGTWRAVDFADSAAYYSAYASANFGAERAKQLAGLRRIGRAWARGLPAEK